jgi:hypothetical protein
MTKAESSRRNGAKSRGPKTAAGKAKSALNSITFGISAKTLILENENAKQFLRMLNSYMAYLKPSNQVEIDLVFDMVAARWRLRRIWRCETAMLDIEMDAQAPNFEKRFIARDEDMRGSLAWASLADTGKGLGTAMRYEAPPQPRVPSRPDRIKKLQNEPENGCAAHDLAVCAQAFSRCSQVVHYAVGQAVGMPQTALLFGAAPELQKWQNEPENWERTWGGNWQSGFRQQSLARLGIDGERTVNYWPACDGFKSCLRVLTTRSAIRFNSSGDPFLGRS